MFWKFETPGSYNFSYNLYYLSKKTNKQELIAKTSCNINVLAKPTSGKYMRVYVTTGNVVKGGINGSCIKGFSDGIPVKTQYPYRDFDGKLLGLNWKYMFDFDFRFGGGL